MYSSQHQLFGQYALGDQRAASRQAAERYHQLSAAAEARSAKIEARREARARRRGHSVAVA